MPLKLNISTSRKIGAPNYGSRGATVGLEMEVEASLIHQPQRLQDRIAHLFRLAKESVDRELNSQAGHGANGATENCVATSQEPKVRRATRRQVSAICAIAEERQIDLTAELQSRFCVERPEDLAITEASDLIDALKQRCQNALRSATGEAPEKTPPQDAQEM